MKKEEFKLIKPINHIAFIMDGNGRWAKKRLLPRTAGHKEGCKRIIENIRTCKRLGIKVVTLYAFSTENWNRPQKEIDLLFEYLKDFDIIGADVVELAPDYDASGVSTAVAGKVIRELLMVM